MYKENTYVHLPNHMIGSYDDRMHRMVRQNQPPFPPPPPPPRTTAKAHFSQSSTRILNESIKSK